MVTNVNEAPMFTRDTADLHVTTGAYVYAGKVGNRVIDPDGVFRATDPDGSSDTLTYSLTAGNDVFSINSRTGALTAKVKLTTTPPIQTVTVVVRDLAGANDTQAEVTITVQAVTAEKNKKPVFGDTVTSAFDVLEGAVIDDDRNIGDPVIATDGDATDKSTYRLSGADATHFDINPDTGAVDASVRIGL